MSATEILEVIFSVVSKYIHTEGLKEMTHGKKQRKYTLLKGLAVMTLLLVMFSSSASAAGYERLETNPPKENLQAGTNFKITVYVTDPPVPSGTITVTINSVTYPNIAIALDPTTGKGAAVTPTINIPRLGLYPVHISIKDSTGKEVATGDDSIRINNPPNTIPEFPSYAVPVIAMLGIFFVFGRRIK